jgi:hypothetical protein
VAALVAGGQRSEAEIGCVNGRVTNRDARAARGEGVGDVDGEFGRELKRLRLRGTRYEVSSESGERSSAGTCRM